MGNEIKPYAYLQKSTFGTRKIVSTLTIAFLGLVLRSPNNMETLRDELQQDEPYLLKEANVEHHVSLVGYDKGQLLKP